MRHRLLCVLAVAATVAGVATVSAVPAAATPAAASPAAAPATARLWHAHAGATHATALSPDRVRLSWSNPRQAGFAGMIIRRDGVTVAHTTSRATSYLDRGLAPGHRYSYTVIATDTTHRSGKAVRVTAQTPRALTGIRPHRAIPTARASAPNASTGGITGTVTDGSAHHLANVDVVVYDDQDDPVAETFTAGNGQYLIDALAPADYTVCFGGVYATGGSSTTGYASECYDDIPWNGEYGNPAAGSTPVSVAAGTNATANAQLAAGGAISGTVTEAAGAHGSIADVDAIIFDANDYPLADAETGSNGKYRVNGLQPGTYFVCFNASQADGASPTGYLSRCYRNTPWDTFDLPSGASPVTVQAAAVKAGINGKLPTAGAISGTVTAADGGVSLDGYTVDVYDPDGNFVQVNETTDPDTGMYQVSGLAPSASGYTVCFDASGATGGPSSAGYIDQCYNGISWDGNDLPSGTTAVPVTAGSVHPNIDAALADGGAIAGTVTAVASGHAVRSVDVDVFLDGEAVGYGFTGSNGTYTVPGLAASDTGYTVCFETGGAAGGGSTTGYVPQCYQNVPWDGGDLPDGTTPVAVTAGEEQDGIDAQLVSAGAISGTATAASGGAKLGGVDAIVFDSSGDYVTDQLTSDLGSYRITGLAPSSTYLVCFDASGATGGSSSGGYRSQCYSNRAWDGEWYDIPTNATPVTVTGGAIRTGVNARLAAGGAISGAVTAADDGSGLENVEVEVYTANGDFIVAAVTGSDGTYRIAGLPASPASGYLVCFDAVDTIGGPSGGGYLDQCYDGVAWDGLNQPSGTPVSVTIGAETGDVSAALATGGGITGTVTSAAHGSGVAGVDIYVFDGDGNQIGYGETRPNGRYSVDGLPATATGDVVCFDTADASGGGSATGYLPQCYNGVAWEDFSLPPDATLVPVTAGAEAQNINAALQSAGAIAGTVTAVTGGAGLEGVEVNVLTTDGEYLNSTETNSDGTYRINGIEPSTPGYVVCFDASSASGGTSPGGYRSQCYRNQAWNPGDVPPAGATLVSVSAGLAHNGITARLASAGGIAGTVTAASDNSPIEGVSVVILDASGNEIGEDDTDADGSYQVNGLALAADTVCFYAQDVPGPDTGYADECYNNVAWDGASGYLPAGVTKVRPHAATVTGGIDAVLDAGGAISGTITSAATSHAVQDGVVIAFDSHGFVNSLGTSADGYTMTGVNPATGPYTVCFADYGDTNGSTTGYAPQCYDGQPWDGSGQTLPAGTTPVSVTAGDTTPGISAALTAAGGISGKVTEDGAGVAGAFIDVFDSAGTEVGGTATSASGTYRVNGLTPAGPGYTVCFTDSANTAYQPQCYRGIAWDGNAEDLPAGTTAVPVTAGGIKGGINAALQHPTV